jgi:hypothetical protein
MTVNLTFGNTMTKLKYMDKFHDVSCILLFPFCECDFTILSHAPITTSVHNFQPVGILDTCMILLAEKLMKKLVKYVM